MDESDLGVSANAAIPAPWVQPGLEMVIEVDPAGALDPSLGLPRRIPESGRMAIPVYNLPEFDLTVIPFLWETSPDSAVIDSAAAMARNPRGHELLWATRTLLPVADLNVTAHVPVLTSSNYAPELLRQTRAIQVLEGGSGYYMGMMTGTPEQRNPGSRLRIGPGQLLGPARHHHGTRTRAQPEPPARAVRRRGIAGPVLSVPGRIDRGLGLRHSRGGGAGATAKTGHHVLLLAAMGQ